MVCRGHRLETLLNDYPISTLTAMMKAASHNRREEIAIETQGVATAVLHGLDCGFNKGKGKVLTKFMKALLKKPADPKKSKDMAGVEDQLFSLLGPRK
jgi:hypothetical protein